MSQKLQVIEDNYVLNVQFFQNISKFQLITSNDDQKFRKYMSQLNFSTAESEICQFQNADELYKFMKNRNNFVINPDEGSIILIWIISTTNFQKRISDKITLQQVFLSEQQILKCQITFLRKKIEVIQNKSYLTKQRQKRTYTMKDQQKQNQIYKYNQTQKQNRSQNQKKIKKREIIQNKMQKMRMRENVDDSPNDNNFKTAILYPTKKQCKNLRVEFSTKKQEQQKQKTLNLIKNSKQNNTNVQESERFRQKQCDSVKVRVDFSNGDYYYGCMKNKNFHGPGLYFSKLNGSYQGEWKNGVPNGFGTSIDKEGNKYQGLHEDDLKHGQGTDWYYNGEKYEGSYVKGYKQGFGKYIYSNGEYFEGTWKNDMAEGPGQEHFQDGSWFEGFWKQDKKHGEGTFHSLDGDIKQFYKNGELISETVQIVQFN